MSRGETTMKPPAMCCKPILPWILSQFHFVCAATFFPFFFSWLRRQDPTQRHALTFTFKDMSGTCQRCFGTWTEKENEGNGTCGVNEVSIELDKFLSHLVTSLHLLSALAKSCGAIHFRPSSKDTSTDPPGILPSTSSLPPAQLHHHLQSPQSAEKVPEQFWARWYVKNRKDRCDSR